MSQQRLNRRAFTGALAAAAPLVVAGCGGGPQAPQPEAKLPEKSEKIEPPVVAEKEPEAKIEPPAEPSPKPATPVDLLSEWMRLEFPHELEPEQLALIRKDLQRQLLRSKILSSFPLKNSDEPAGFFAAWRAPDPDA